MREVFVFAWKVELELKVGERTVWSRLWDDDGNVADHVQMLGRGRAVLGHERGFGRRWGDVLCRSVERRANINISWTYLLGC